jgi:hypothetical protein
MQQIPSHSRKSSPADPKVQKQFAKTNAPSPQSESNMDEFLHSPLFPAVLGVAAAFTFDESYDPLGNLGLIIFNFFVAAVCGVAAVALPGILPAGLIFFSGRLAIFALAVAVSSFVLELRR